MDVFNLAAKLTLDSSEYDRDLGKAEENFSVFGDVLKGNLATEAIVKGLDLVASAAKTAAEGLYNLIKDSVMAYADYEQLVGGVQKLYGNMGLSVEEYAAQNGKSVEEVRDEWQRLEEAQNLVLENAENAYKTSGMSMNEYMEAATSFSASLINSLGGDTREAAELTDVAMQNISDNFNTFGGDIGMIQGAFQGFAKQNYTMLDNLKLGYGGTKSEMERLIEDANEYADTIGETSDLSIDSFSDIVKAIDLVQRKQNIRGTTAREAEKTIQGSINTTKAAYKNLLTAIGGGGDVDEAFDNFISSFENTVDNIIPVIERIIPAIGKIIEKIAPLVEEYLPVLIEEVSPLFEDAITIIGGAILDLLGELLPKLGSFLLEKLKELALWIIDNNPFIQTWIAFVASLTAVINEVIEWIVGIVNTTWERIQAVWNTVQPYFEAIWEGIKTVFSTVADVLSGFFSAAWEAIKTVWDVVTGYFETIWESIKKIFSVVESVFKGDFEGAWKKIKEIVNLWEGYFKDIWEKIKKVFEPVINWFKEKFEGAWEKIKDAFATVSEFFSGIWDTITGVFEDIADWFREKFEAVWDAITKPFDEVGDFFGGIKEKITGFFQFDDADTWGNNLGSDFGYGVENSGIENSLSNVSYSIASAFESSSAYTWGSDLVANFVNGIYATWDWLTGACRSIANTITSWIGFSEPDEGPLSKFHTFAPDMMQLFAQGIKDNEDIVTDQIAKSFDFENLINREYDVNANIIGNNTASIPSVEINVYATERQDEVEIAREVQRVFIQWENQRRAAYA